MRCHVKYGVAGEPQQHRGQGATCQVPGRGPGYYVCGPVHMRPLVEKRVQGIFYWSWAVREVMRVLAMMFEDREAYAIAEAKAAEAIRELDPELVTVERNVEFDADAGRFLVPVLGDTLSISFPAGEVSRAGGQRLTGAIAIVALHYLFYQGEPLRVGEWLAYRDMPGGRDFSRAFESMAEARLAAHFGERPDEFSAAALALGGEPVDTPEHSFTLKALPRVPLRVILWPACEEVAGAARILFQPSAPYYLHTEDLAALGILAVDRLIGHPPG